MAQVSQGSENGTSCVLYALARQGARGYGWSLMEIDPHEVKRRLDEGQILRLVDVREPFEHEQAHIEGSELIPMRNIPQALESLRASPGTLVVVCHHGIRSLQVVGWLRGQGITDCLSMAGGIDRWSCEIDPTIPRYY